MESTQPKPFVFTVMPFAPEFDDLYKLGIKPACESAGAYCERLDEQIFDEGMLDRIFNQIAKADVVIAEMTGKNPNVFYEVGYAHALGKRVVLLTKDAADIPFDLKHRPHIVHGGRISELKTSLQTRVAHYVANPLDKRLDSIDGLEFYLNGVRLEPHKRFYVGTTHYKDLSFSVHNHDPVGFELIDFLAALITPSNVTASSPSGRSRGEFTTIPMPDGRNATQDAATHEIAVGGSCKFGFTISSHVGNLPNPCDVILRILHKGPPRVIPFTLTAGEK